MVDLSSNDSISTRTIDGELELFKRMATTSIIWFSKQVVQKKAPGVYEVDVHSALSRSTNAARIKKLSCEECGADRNISDCPILV